MTGVAHGTHEAWAERESSAEPANPENVTVQQDADSLRKELEERQAVIRRLQGESFLLATQVKQLEQQIVDASKDAQTCSSQLAQVLQLMDSTGGRVPLKGEVDRARALVTAARRSIRRISCWSNDDQPHSSRGAQHAQHVAAGPPSDRRPSPHGRPRSPRGDPPAHQRESQAGLAASAVAAVGEDQKGINGSLPHGAPSKPERQSRSKGATKDMRNRRPRERASVDGHSDAENAQVSAVSASRMSSKEPVPDAQLQALQAQLSEVQQACARQRELLVRAVRKGSQLEEQVTSMTDEVIKKDVIIHNLRQDLSGQQQELKQQQLQFEQHMQQMQQNHLQQLQQQACQIQELQLLQIQRLQKTAQTAEEAVCLPLEPSFG
eukprot:CAMPEP_0114684346 /NCGR_PEP_ID=MMETSP0191-20121206/58992_1 /TAXON_ID=126664 /ORGANISM="Sorites sp." /LENGTH=378 /DNA_ID=CAMNT_0001966949 /DNA_START=81 /DNA_END=1214 /DNA_ORIENTATION=+